MQGPQLCAGYCGRMLRPHNTRPGDYPDTLTMVKEGKCSACLVGGTPRFVPPANCTGCSRPFRTHKNPDGEVRHFAKGLCTICTNRAKRGPKKERTIDLRPCLRCGRMTRTERVKAAEAPGTVKRYKSNMCQTCHRVTSGQRAGNAPLVKA